MKYLLLTLRFIFSLFIFGLNFAVNLLVCIVIRPYLGLLIPSSILSLLAQFLIVAYMIFQILLLIYLMARSMIYGCKKHGIKYQ